MISSVSIPKIILDTDPGGDDIFALLWVQSLVNQGLADLIAITATAGNVSAHKTFSNVSQILNLVGSAPIEVGQGVSLDRDASDDAAHIHGSDGMGNLSKTLPPPTHDYQTARYADEILIDKLTLMPGEITLVAIGPLTNLAAAEKKSPGILKRAKEIVIMGGGFFCPGNVTPQAEFNIWFNAEAADVVLSSRDDVVILPLDVTRNLIFTREMVQTIAPLSSANDKTIFINRLCEFMITTAIAYRETNGVSGFLVHDAATIGYLFYPETLLISRARVCIETRGEWTRGQTVIDRRGGAKQSANAWVAMQVDSTGFFARFIEDLKTLVR